MFCMPRPGVDVVMVSQVSGSIVYAVVNWMIFLSFENLTIKNKSLNLAWLNTAIVCVWIAII